MEFEALQIVEHQPSCSSFKTEDKFVYIYVFMVSEPEVQNQGEICLFFLIYLLIQSFTDISVDSWMFICYLDY